VDNECNKHIALTLSIAARFCISEAFQAIFLMFHAFGLQSSFPQLCSFSEASSAWKAFAISVAIEARRRPEAEEPHAAVFIHAYDHARFCFR
jgi:hypothetical protein